jgi:(p)ppGpp synthase/HD superfamily hydrolase
MANLERAIQIATEAHEGQFRRDGKPYITHPLAVMYMLQRAGFPEHYQIKGVFHDIIEDTDYTAVRLIEEGFDKERVVKGVVILSKEDDEPYEVYEQEILESYEESQVKARDILHNLASDPRKEKIPIYLSLLTRIALKWGLEYNPDFETAA